MTREVVERLLDHLLTIALGAVTTTLFVMITFFGVVGVKEDNLFIRNFELSTGIIILTYGIYRLVRMIKERS